MIENVTPYMVTRTPHEPLTKVLNEAAGRINRRERIRPAWRMKPTGPQAKGFRSSSLHDCQRRVGYRLAGTPKTNDTFVVDYDIAAEQGNTIHRILQDQANEAGLVWEHPTFGPALELPLALSTAADLQAEREALPFTGTIDGVFRDKAGNLLCFDVKTVKSAYLAEGNQWFAEKIQGYASQLSSYLHYFATPEGEKAKYALVYVVSRDDTANRRALRISWQPERWAHDAERVTVASDAVKAGDLPQPEVSSACRFCEWRSLCPSGGKKR